MNSVLWVNCGILPYNEGWKLQRTIFDLRQSGKIGDVMLLTEHHHVYSLGKSSDENHLLSKMEVLKSENIDVVHTDRGGDVTYHGPGQLIGYPILDLNGYFTDIHRYLRNLEEVIILTLEKFGIPAQHDPDYTGVWVGNDKIAAIGIKVNRWITMHGFALNVNTDLSYFDKIIPCGIFHKGVTSIAQQLNREVPLNDVMQILVDQFARVFAVEITEITKEELLTRTSKLSTITECVHLEKQ